MIEIILFSIINLCIEPTDRIEYADKAYPNFLEERMKNEIAGTSGKDHKVLWIFSPRCSKKWLSNIIAKHGHNMKNLEFISIRCWERKANTPPFEIKL